MKRFAAAVALVLSAATLVSVASAQDTSKKILPTMRMDVPAAIERTPEQMSAFDATNAAAGITREVPFRPTMDAAQYAQLKAGAAMAPRAASRPNSGAAPTMLAAVSTKFVGGTECDGDGLSFGCWLPPDVAGSIGKTQYVSVNNNMFEVRSRAGGLLKTSSLNSLCGGYSAQPMFDPRVQWDEEYQRWVITAAAFAESSTVQKLCLAVSQTSSATGKFWVYVWNITPIGGTGSFYDFPMLGMSQDSVLLTANIFGATAFEGSSLFSIAKARVYNGLSFFVPVFTGLIATLEPGHQLLTDQNPYAWLAAAPGNSGQIWMYAEGNGSNAFSAFLNGPYQVTGVSAYGFPPAAPQPASCAPSGANLDTSDNRFQNTGTQNGDTYYQVHTTGDFGFATTRYYVISGLLSFAPAVSVSNDFFASGSSYDFNPSIASDPTGHFGIGWSSTDPTNNVLASERFTDNNGGNPAGSTGINVFTSASCYNGVGTNRWGDYSQTSLDPGTGSVASTTTKTFWIDNETIPSANFWSTEIAKMKY